MPASRQLAVVGCVLAACAAPPSTSFEVERAERLRAAGRADAALRMTDRVIARGSYSPTRELVALHTSLLREEGRLVEARSLEEFAARYFAGERTDRVGEELSRRDCGRRQEGLDLILSWAQPVQGFWAIGVIVATVEIGADGGIGNVVVHSARDPASAWGAIDSIARARVHQRRVEALYEEDSSPCFVSPPSAGRGSRRPRGAGWPSPGPRAPVAPPRRDPPRR